jgi:hypothetical protein
VEGEAAAAAEFGLGQPTASPLVAEARPVDGE